MRDEIITVRSGDQRISTRIVGQGPLVILMHGWPELGLSWRNQIGPIAEAGFTVAAPDMRGYGASSKPDDHRLYDIDAMADDMAAVADALGREHWVSIGHDWGAPVAWRTALRFPDRVTGVFALSIPHSSVPQIESPEVFDLIHPDKFYYVRYFQPVGPAERELEADVRDALKRIFFSLSGDAPLFDWTRPRPAGDTLLAGLTPPPPGPLSFMSDATLDAYAAAYAAGGFFGPLSWYRNFETDYRQGLAYGDNIIRQPAGFLCGDREIALDLLTGGIERQRDFLTDLRCEIVLPGAGHWVQQERPEEVSRALLAFLDGL